MQEEDAADGYDAGHDAGDEGVVHVVLEALSNVKDIFELLEVSVHENDLRGVCRYGTGST